MNSTCYIFSLVNCKVEYICFRLKTRYSIDDPPAGVQNHQWNSSELNAAANVPQRLSRKRIAATDLCVATKKPRTTSDTFYQTTSTNPPTTTTDGLINCSYAITNQSLNHYNKFVAAAGYPAQLAPLSSPEYYDSYPINYHSLPTTTVPRYIGPPSSHWYRPLANGCDEPPPPVPPINHHHHPLPIYIHPAEQYYHSNYYGSNGPSSANLLHQPSTMFHPAAAYYNFEAPAPPPYIESGRRPWDYLVPPSSPSTISAKQNDNGKTNLLLGRDLFRYGSNHHQELNSARRQSGARYDPVTPLSALSMLPFQQRHI